jgi:WD40-like Beta Propeller Repeat
VRWKTIAAIAVLAIGGSVGAACVGDEAPVTPDDAGADSGAAGDATSEAVAADAGCLARPFSRPAPVPGINTVTWTEWDGRLSGDELSIFFASDRPTDAGRPDGFFEPFDLYEARRVTPTGTFGPPTLVAASSPTAGDFHPTISKSNLALYFQTNRSGRHEIWGATRVTADGVFQQPTAIAALNGAPASGEPMVVGDSQVFYFSQGQDIDGDIDIMRLDLAKGGPPVPLRSVNSSASDLAPFVTPDELTIYFGSFRGGGSFDIFMARRASVNEDFPTPAIVNELSSSSDDAPSWVSPDGCRVLLWSSRNGGNFDIYQSARQ